MTAETRTVVVEQGEYDIAVTFTRRDWLQVPTGKVIDYWPVTGLGASIREPRRSPLDDEVNVVSMRAIKWGAAIAAARQAAP